MINNLQYYCVGFKWKGAEQENQLSRFLDEGIWINGFENKYIQKVKLVNVGSRIALKTTYTIKEDNKTISILKIFATGTVIKNPNDGQILNIRWDERFEPFILKGKGAYRSTISRIHDLKIIRKIFKNDQFLIGENEIPFYSIEEFRKEYYSFPCFVLTRVRWDDFGFKTLYRVAYYSSSEEFLSIGEVKFLNKEKHNGEIPTAFTLLDDNFCSLGQSNNYYFNLRKLIDKKTAVYYLDAINDLAINHGLIDSFELEEGFKTSLLRNSEAEKALVEGERIFNGVSIDNVLKFTFSAQIGSATDKHSIKFDFSKDSSLPFRIKVLIGKNGSGKTQYLANLAATLSGHATNGEFSTKYRPPFSRVIAVSYSLFDRFIIPKQTKKYGYYYCGFQSSKGFLTENQIHTRIKKSLSILDKLKRIHLFKKYISLIFSDEFLFDFFSEDYFELNPKEFSLYDENNYSIFSSGQIVMILILAEVLSYIIDESLLLFDEPETHLHPNGISLLMKVLNRILDKFNSYSIISTHSAQVIQEVPSKDIIVIERLGNTPSLRSLDIETFGENLHTITERIFQTTSHDEYYREFLQNFSKSKDYKEIIEIFEENSLPLSLNAKIYLQSLYKQ